MQLSLGKKCFIRKLSTTYNRPKILFFWLCIFLSRKYDFLTVTRNSYPLNVEPYTTKVIKRENVGCVRECREYEIFEININPTEKLNSFLHSKSSTLKSSRGFEYGAIIKDKYKK